jgi:hypothetical protein
VLGGWAEKHLLFVLLRVLRIAEGSPVVYQRALLQSELSAIFEVLLYLCSLVVARRSLFFGRRSSLVARRSLCFGRRLSIVARRPLVAGRRPSLVGRRYVGL